MGAVIAGADGAEADETGTADVASADSVDNTPGGQPDTNTDAEAFPREYVEKLRGENAEQRTKAKAAQDEAGQLARRLHTAMVEATGRLENAAELAFDADHLGDPDKLDAAISALLEAKPYVAKRKVAGDVGQGQRGAGGGSGPSSFAELFGGGR